MKKLPLFLAILMATLLFNSCAHQWMDYSKKVGVSRPKPEGRPFRVVMGPYDAMVYGNCVHFKQQPDLGLLNPQEVWVYNLDRDPADTYDSVWIRPEGPASWEFHQKAKLLPGSNAVPNSAKHGKFFDWIENAYQARNHANRHRPQPRPPEARPVPEEKAPSSGLTYEYKTYERP